LNDLTPQIPWKPIKDFRNYSVHNYDDIDPEIVWDVIQIHLPAIKQNINLILAEI
jgi:uncharacterized protein with HEPN domain